MNKTLFGIVLILIFVGIAVYLYTDASGKDYNVETDGSATENNDITEEVQPVEEVDSPDSDNDLIVIESPQVGEEVGSPISVSGKVRGTWLFEATAPVIVTNWDGLILGEGYIETSENWMTEKFVPFSGEITYQQQPNSYSATGTIIFQKANPSGLPEHADALEIRVLLENNS
jgi:hypothetical protein